MDTKRCENKTRELRFSKNLENDENKMYIRPCARDGHSANVFND